MKKIKQLHSSRKGIAIPMVLIAIVLLLLINMSVLSMGLNERVYAIRTASDISAQCAADAGLTKARFEINKKIQGESWFDDELPAESNIQLSNLDAEYNYTVSVNEDGDYVIESTGISGINQRTVSCVIERRSSFDCAIFTDGPFQLRNFAAVDWYNYSGAYTNLAVGTNSTNNGAINLENNASIKGNVVVGPGGDPEEVVNLSHSAEIGGETSSLILQKGLSLPEVPDWLQSFLSGGTIENNTTISSDGKYDGIKLEQSETLTITDDVTLYITGDVEFSNSAQLVIEEGASLILYLGKDLKCEQLSEISNETEIPKNLQMYGLEDCEHIELRNHSDLYGVIYAPNAKIKQENLTTIYGSVIGDSYEAKEAAKVMYDASLRNESLSAGPITYVVTQWNENR